MARETMQRAGAAASASLILGAFALLGLPTAASAEGPPSLGRYDLANGCFSLRSESAGANVAKVAGTYVANAAPGGGEKFRMQATALGKYLFYGPAPDFMARTLLNTVAPAASPSNDADWTISEAGSAFRIVNQSSARELIAGGGGLIGTAAAGAGGNAGLFTFDRVTGCATYPEVEVNVEGAPRTGQLPFQQVVGTVEGHMHGMAYEFLGGGAHCGEPFNRFGAPTALVDCPDHHPNGCSAVLENVLYGNPARCHDPVGWPTFADWPAPESLTHEQSYHRWIERAWRGGLRVYVNLMVENRVLCEVYPIKHNSCDEMTSVRLQIQRLHEMQDYIDAQNGGPGEGWFRIVRDPFEARRVINDGKLAVIMGMEVSEPLGCRLASQTAQCDSADIVAGLDELRAMGIRQLEIVNKFDNALTGVAGDSGTTGTITNSANFLSTGSFWDYDTCTDPHNHDRSPAAIHNVDQGLANGLNAFLPPGALPAYPPEPHCNQLGLTPLGETAVRRIMTNKMIFDPDHMSVIARNKALDVLESEQYAGIISSHSWSTDNALTRIMKLGGMITPYAGGSEGFAAQWRKLKQFKDQFGSQFFGLGYGADMNGFGAQGDPRGAGVPNPVTYPFPSIDGSATIYKQVSGQRVYDINVDGVAHYGLYPDWIQDLRMIAGDEIVKDLSNGAEAYLQMWERTEGIPGSECREWPGTIGAGGIGSRLSLGADAQSALYSAGQPESRASAWRWCALETLPGAAKKKAKKKKKKKKGSKKRAFEGAQVAETDQAGEQGDAHAYAKKGKKKKKKKKKKRKPAAGAAAKAPVGALFDSSGRVTLILSALRNHTTPRGFGPGTSAKVLLKKAKKAKKRKKGKSAAKKKRKKKKKATGIQHAGSGVYVQGAGGGKRFVYVVKGKTVRYAGVASASIPDNAALVTAVGQVGLP